MAHEAPTTHTYDIVIKIPEAPPNIGKYEFEAYDLSANMPEIFAKDLLSLKIETVGLDPDGMFMFRVNLAAGGNPISKLHQFDMRTSSVDLVDYPYIPTQTNLYNPMSIVGHVFVPGPARAGVGVFETKAAHDANAPLKEMRLKMTAVCANRKEVQDLKEDLWVVSNDGTRKLRNQHGLLIETAADFVPRVTA